MTLQKFKTQADIAEKAFDNACQIYYCDGRWGYYRAVECDHIVPKVLHDRCDDYLAALHAFYLKRDGSKGFFGSRGL
jgi:hypothetical protein